MERQDAMASTLVVIAGSGYNAQHRQDNTVLHTERDPEVIGRVADLLATRGGESHAWMEWPRVSLVFLDGRAVIAEYGVLGGARWLRTSLDGDRAIERPEELAAWLVEVGAPADNSDEWQPDGWAEWTPRRRTLWRRERQAELMEALHLDPDVAQRVGREEWVAHLRSEAAELRRQLIVDGEAVD